MSVEKVEKSILELREIIRGLEKFQKDYGDLSGLVGQEIEKARLAVLRLAATLFALRGMKESQKGEQGGNRL